MKYSITVAGKKIEAIVFDMDGLIFDTEKVVQQSWSLASKELNLPDVGEHIYHTIGFSRASRREYYFKVFGPDFPAEEFSALTRVKFREIADKNGIRKKPGIEELLKYLKQINLKTAVATSSSRAYAENLLKEAGLRQYFDACVFGDSVVSAKPNPEIYIKACALLEVKPTCAMALEDAPSGIQAAHAAGMIPVMIPDLVKPTLETAELCYKISDTLFDILAMLEGIREDTEAI